MFGMLALLAFASFSLVLAENNTSNISVSDNTSLISPAPTLYSDNSSLNVSDDEQTVGAFRYGWENFKLFFMRNETNRIQQELRLANWKLAEARRDARNKDFNGTDNALREHDALISQIRDEVQKLKDSNQSLTPGLDQAISVHEERLARLNASLQNSNLTDDQRSKIEDRISKLENNTAHLDEVRAQVRERRSENLSEFENKTQNRIENQTERADRIVQRVQNRTQNESSGD
ncbi:Uncharacterised protein [uncultured archaeon]|nr:Uncharacterised protein [uncultured archaeon]